MMEYINFLKFCEQLKISKENEGGALGKKLQQLDPTDRVSCVYELLGHEDLVTPMDLFPHNPTSEVRYFLRKLQDFYDNEDHLSVVQNATRVIQSSRANTREMKYAYLHRATSLFNLERYHEGVWDANRSLRIQLDEGERNTISHYKSLCLDKLLDDQNSSKFKVKINPDDLDPNFEEIFKLPKIENPHEWIPNVSKKIEIQFSTEYGRFLVAAKNISPGEILFVDKPYAYVLGHQWEATHCSHCFVRCMSLISCPNCQNLFCSDSCRSQAFLQYHRIECQILNNQKSKIFDLESRLALRMLMIATRQGKDLKNLSKHPIYKNPFDPIIRPVNKRHFREPYYHIHNLESHDKELKNYDLVRLSYKAAVLIELLRWTTFFPITRDLTAKPHSLTREQLFVSSLLMRYLSIIKFNGGMIKERVERPEKLQDGPFFFDVFQLGFAIYPISSYINHSCDSNSMIVSFKTSCACYAIQPILKGEQVFINYECHYLLHPLEYRMQRLQETYYFKCRCRPCREKWGGMRSKPKLHKISSRLSNEEMQRCITKMEQLVNVSNVKERYKPEHMNFLQDLMTKFYTSTKHPNLTYQNAMSLFSALLMFEGNNYELADNHTICHCCYYESRPPSPANS